ncbi:hypothetical protein SAMN02745127_02087 [Oceanospirillum multiglobuliferum]|uniref:Uncharacterized protein n=1 Tax=Oceanospirillum multiglobuliferum TaxID=64969 RepID=A0A1T4QZ54_9GAMM|nr:hypothetical protein [Oceanospirillum multiglobuliferum]OPX57053.1 hypothetical protein BTE48_01080 [Oceanospirillum multiglobuliferum]SKA08877.1 hypothetical protein SAMN02745127_02087 [Oceanospirillum multiglobuliferum]
MKTPVAPWFGRLVSEELSRLYLLRLEYSPSNDTFPAVVEVWVDLLWNSRSWVESLDSKRLRVGFNQLLLSQRTWPKPADLIQSMPDRPPVMALPAPELTPEQKQKNLVRIAELIARLGQPSRRKKDDKSAQA